MENIKLRKFGRAILAFLSSCCLVILLWILVDCFTNKATATEKIISYKVSDSVEYTVTMKDNQFYTSDEANESNLYITSLMDTMQVRFDYDLVGSKYFSSEYDYIAIINLTSSDDKSVIWSYEEEILSQEKGSAVDVIEVNVNDSFNVDLSSLYTKAKEFYDLTGYEVELDIKIKISNTLKVNDYDEGISDKQTMSISIPLTDKVASIKKSNDNSINKKIIDQYDVNEDFNTYLFVISIALIVCIAPVTVRSYIALFNLTNLDNYDRKLKRLKSRYSYIIKNIVKEPNFDNKEVYEVLSCNELAIICGEKDLSLNLYEKKKGKECWFYVVDKKDVYMYILTLDYNHIALSNKGELKIKNKKKNKKSK